MSKVDVIIPAYNAARFLPGAIESVLAQTETAWRILLVDDGSTDNTREVVESFARLLGDRFRYIFQENRGLPAARNTAIRNSSSPLLALLDADDLWLPNRLADSLASFAGRPEVGLSYGRITRFSDTGAVIDTFAGNGDRGQTDAARWIYTRKIELPCPSVTFRRVCVEKVGMFDETMRATEDRDLWLRIAQHYQVAFVPSVIALYRRTDSSMSGDLPRMLRAQLQFIEKHYGEPGCGWWARQTALGRAYKQQAEGFADRGQHTTALRHAFRAAALAPFDSDNLRTAASIVLRSAGWRRRLSVTPARPSNDR